MDTPRGILHICSVHNTWEGNGTNHEPFLPMRCVFFFISSLFDSKDFFFWYVNMDPKLQRPSFELESESLGDDASLAVKGGTVTDAHDMSRMGKAQELRVGFFFFFERGGKGRKEKKRG